MMHCSFYRNKPEIRHSHRWSIQNEKKMHPWHSEKSKRTKTGKHSATLNWPGHQTFRNFPQPHCGNTSMRELARAALGGRKPISDRVKKAHESSCISERASSFARLSWRLENWSSRKKSMLISRELKRHKCIRNIVLCWIYIGFVGGIAAIIEHTVAMLIRHPW